MRKSHIAAAIFGLMLTAGAQAQSDVTECDLLAGAPNDQQGVTEGVPFARIVALEAIEACYAAIGFDPSNPRLQFQLARALQAGGDVETAFGLYVELLENGYAVAANNAAGMALNGLGTTQDTDLALQYYELAADMGDPTALVNLGEIYDAGVYAPEDPTRAFDYFTAAAELGMSRAMDYLGYYYAIGRGTEQDGEQAFAWYSRGAELGSADSMHGLGTSYETGTGVAADLAQSYNWYRRAADLGHADAALQTGYFLLDGTGTPSDPLDAIDYFTLAAGHASTRGPATLQLGWLLTFSELVPADPVEGLGWFQAAVALGVAESYFYMGQVYEFGAGVPVDIDAAMDWYKAGSKRDNVDAKVSYAYYLTEGPQERANAPLAVALLEEAVLEGDSMALNNLGYAYEMGEGVAIDYQRAAELYLGAVQQGNAFTIETLVSDFAESDPQLWVAIKERLFPDDGPQDGTVDVAVVRALAALGAYDPAILLDSFKRASAP